MFGNKVYSKYIR